MTTIIALTAPGRDRAAEFRQMIDARYVAKARDWFEAYPHPDSKNDPVWYEAAIQRVAAALERIDREAAKVEGK